MPRFPNEIEYSEKYFDDYFEYRHVTLPKDIYQLCPQNSLMAEKQWRELGVQQSRGWIHYNAHKPEPYILLFRRPRGTDPNTGYPPIGWKDPDAVEIQGKQNHEKLHKPSKSMEFNENNNKNICNQVNNNEDFTQKSNNNNYSEFQQLQEMINSQQYLDEEYMDEIQFHIQNQMADIDEDFVYPKINSEQERDEIEKIQTEQIQQESNNIVCECDEKMISDKEESDQN